MLDEDKTFSGSLVLDLMMSRAHTLLHLYLHITATSLQRPQCGLVNHPVNVVSMSR